MRSSAPVPERIREILVLGLIMGVLVLLSGQAAWAEPSKESHDVQVHFRRIMLLPVYDLRAVYGDSFSMQGPLTGRAFNLDQIDPEATDFVRKKIHAVLEQKGSFHLMSPAPEDVEAMVGVAPVAGERAGRIALIRKAAERKGADAALCTYVYAFRNRVGTDYGVESPTTVSFEMNLVSTATGRIVWQRDFTETQATLNENLLQLGKFIKRKGRWVTAEEMAARAIEDLLENLP